MSPQGGTAKPPEPSPKTITPGVPLTVFSSMDSRPVFRVEENGELTLGALPAALAVEREHLSHIGSGTPFKIQAT
ncbi:hypothetical protein AOLI_G00188160 [Acnodon oligacanthus]